MDPAAITPATVDAAAAVTGNPAYAYCADAIVILHFLFMAFIAFGQLAIIIAAGFKWEWGRNPWFRFAHLGSILFVVYEAVLKIRCPLTEWEESLRGLAGQQMGDSQTFIGHYAHKWLFWDDKTSAEVIFAVTICFGIIVLQGVIMYPPRWFRRRGTKAQVTNTTTPTPTTPATPKPMPTTNNVAAAVKA